MEITHSVRAVDQSDCGAEEDETCTPVLTYILDALREYQALAGGSGFTRLYPASGLHEETTAFLSHVVANNNDLGGGADNDAGGTFVKWAHRLPAHFVFADVLK